jgi:hypothetical protein
MTNPPVPTKDELLDFRISSIINSAEDAMFQKFDDLHKQGHNDDDVINYLRKQGYTDYADAYIEWSGALDPDREDDNTTMNPVVPDPADAPSYAEHPLNTPIYPLNKIEDKR